MIGRQVSVLLVCLLVAARSQPPHGRRVRIPFRDSRTPCEASVNSRVPLRSRNCPAGRIYAIEPPGMDCEQSGNFAFHAPLDQTYAVPESRPQRRPKMILPTKQGSVKARRHA